MSTTRLLGFSLGGALAGAGIGAALCAATGATGASIMGHYREGFDVSEAAKMGAAGGSIIISGVGAMSAALASANCFDKFANTGIKIGASVCGVVLGIGSFFASGIAGYGLLNISKATVMKLAETAEAFAVGTPIIGVSAACLFLCICIPLAVKDYVAGFSMSSTSSAPSAPALRV